MQWARSKRESLTRGVSCTVSFLVALVFLPGLHPNAWRSANIVGGAFGVGTIRFVPQSYLQSGFSVDAPVLTLPGDPIRVVENKAKLPVFLQTGGHRLGAVAFSLDLDPRCFTLNPADTDADGVPDALSAMPPGFVVSLLFDAADAGGELDIALYDVSMPIGSLADGALLTIQFEVPRTCRNGTELEQVAPVAFSSSPAVVFSTTGGMRVEGIGVGADVRLLFRSPPAEIRLSAAGVAENLPSGTTVGKLSAVDPDAGDTHTYRLVDDPGGDDNPFFAVAGDHLLTAARFDYEARSAFRVSLQATDSDGLSIQQIKTVVVTDVNEPPRAVDDWVDPLTQVFVGRGGPIDVLANDTDPDRDARLTVASVDPPDLGTAVTDGQVVVFDPPDRASGTAAFAYRIADDAPQPLTDEARITVTFVADDSPGDCNADRQIDAADLAAVVLELFDEPVAAPWYQIHAGGYPGSPQGCDANGDRVVEAGDLACTVLLAFDRSCTSVEAAAEQPVAPGLALHVAAIPSGPAVDVALADPAHSLTALVFTLSYDPAQVELDPTDRDGDGMPDAVAWSLPPQAQAWVFAGPGVLQVAVVMAATPPVPLPDGTLMTVRFDRLENGVPEFGLRQVSAGSTTGSSVSVHVPDDDVVPSSTRRWLPMVGRWS